MQITEILSNITLLCAALAILCMILLHALSPEFNPSWRMISEYAYGKNKRILTLFFILWGISTLGAGLFAMQITQGFWAITGAILILISGIGAIMGGLFDIKHKLHGLSFMLGVPTLPMGAVLVSYQIKNVPLFSNSASTLTGFAHATWISVILMAVSMILMMQSFKKSGIEMGPGAEPPTTLPPGVKAYAGYANRLLVLTYIAWSVVLAIELILNQ